MILVLLAMMLVSNLWAAEPITQESATPSTEAVDKSATKDQKDAPKAPASKEGAAAVETSTGTVKSDDKTKPAESAPATPPAKK